MTTEDDFQAALDAQPDDWQTRLVFADWLEERPPLVIPCRAYANHDTRFDGERHWLYESGGPESKWVLCPHCGGSGTVLDTSCRDRAQGYRAMGVNRIAPVGAPKGREERWRYLCGSLGLPGEQWLPYDWFGLLTIRNQFVSAKSRREAEDAAALAFAKLPADRRAELLAQEVRA